MKDEENIKKALKDIVVSKEITHKDLQAELYDLEELMLQSLI